MPEYMEYGGSQSSVVAAGWRSVSRHTSELARGDGRMARSVTGLFADQRHVDQIVGALIVAGFDAARISAVSADDQTAEAGTPEEQTTARRAGIGAWLVEHLRQRGLSHEHAQRYQQHVTQGHRLVSVVVTTDAEDEEVRSLMVDIGAEEISSAADGTMRRVQRSSAHSTIPPD